MRPVQWSLSMSDYITRDGDMIDWICWHHYGEQSGAVEAVYAANPVLVQYGPLLPAGLSIVLPELPKPVSTVKTVKLWD